MSGSLAMLRSRPWQSGKFEQGGAVARERNQRAHARWASLRSRLREATRLVALRGSVHKLLEELLQVCYCEMIVLTPVSGRDHSAKARKYVDYLERSHIVSHHGGAGGAKELADVLATIVASPGGDGPSGLCVRKQEPVLVENSLTDTRFDHATQRRLGLAGLSQMHVPLLVGKSTQHRRSSAVSLASSEMSTDRMEGIGVLSLINKVDGSGRTGKPFVIETDMHDACATATMIMESSDLYTEDTIVRFVKRLMKSHPDGVDSFPPRSPSSDGANSFQQHSPVNAIALPNAVVDADTALPDTLATDDEVAHELARLSLPEPQHLRNHLKTAVVTDPSPTEARRSGSQRIDGPLLC